ncbi:site-specific DNA-methyltransferase [Tessaracoccus lubricantis]
MSTLSQLLRQVSELNPSLGSDLAKHVNALKRDVPFGLHFERHRPESVRLFGQPVLVGDKVHLLPPRGKSTVTANPVLWHVVSIAGDTAKLIRDRAHGEPVEQTAKVEDLVVVAEFRDDIYPGLVQTGEVVNGPDNAPFHTVINGENYHVLKALTYTHAGKVDAIYIDPPYNTRDKDWKYNNDYVDKEDAYRHSKWLAMMERRLGVARQLLNPDDSVLIVTIDEKEYLRLGMLLDQMFPEARIQMVSVVINGQGSARKNAMSRVDEYIYFAYFGAARPVPAPIETLLSDDNQSQVGAERIWFPLIRGGKSGVRSKSNESFFPVYINRETGAIDSVGHPIPADRHPSETDPVPTGCDAVWPMSKAGSEGRWQMARPEFLSRLSEGYIRVGRQGKDGRWPITYIRTGTIQRIKTGEIVVEGKDPRGALILSNDKDNPRGRTPKTVWYLKSHNAGTYGTDLLNEFLPGRDFPFPKSLYAVEDTLRFFVKGKPDAVVLDFFSGSGTTAHAVMRLNKQDGGRRQCISVTNNEVGDVEASLVKQNLRPGDPDWEKFGICDYITKPRITAAITGRTPDGAPIKGDYKFTGEFPMSDGFEANARFFTLTYEREDVVDQNLAFGRIAPLLWMRAGSVGRIITDIPNKGWEVADSYAILFDIDQENAFVKAVESAEGVRAIYVVTSDQYNFQQVAKRFPSGFDKVMLYRSYLTNFRISNSE